MQDLEGFINSNYPFPLIKAALVHAQFEMIHPFVKGNGRVGRMLIPLLLAKSKMISAPYLYISYFFKHSKKEYYRSLQSISEEGNCERWIKFFLEAILVTTKGGLRRINGMEQVVNKTKDVINNYSASENVLAKMLSIIDMLISNPVISAPNVAKALTVTHATSKNILETLVEIDILQAKRGAKETKYIFREYLDRVEEEHLV